MPEYFSTVDARDSYRTTDNPTMGIGLESLMAKNDNRCWPGYEPVKGKQQHEQGSCRPKAESKVSASEKKFRAKRRKQLDKWEAEHPDSPKSAAQHLHEPGTVPKRQQSKKKTSKVD